MKPAILTAAMKFSSRNDGKEPHHVVTVNLFSNLPTIRAWKYVPLLCMYKMTVPKRQPFSALNCFAAKRF
jgi:hypothetical protein